LCCTRTKTRDEQYFLYTAVYLSGILSPISEEVFEEYERKNLMGRFSTFYIFIYIFLHIGK
ncbi:hypothetical protein P4414_27035, partial [Bacillus thuringiensis]|nr:hypothetical protein [Bacillus thuringiensis]